MWSVEISDSFHLVFVEAESGKKSVNDSLILLCLTVFALYADGLNIKILDSPYDQTLICEIKEHLEGRSKIKIV